jgi:RNA polymerase sigma-70 factor (ECF subfamily)
MIPASDQDLEQVQAQFQALVMPHLDRLLGFAARRTRSSAEAEDAVQEACVRAWLGFAGLRDPAKVRPWLYCILRAVLADNCERDGRRQRLVSITRLEDEHEALVGGDDDAVLVEVDGRLTSEVIRAALADIPEDFATAVEMHDIDGFKYQEIADILGIPIGTVMSRISRGRRLLAGAIAANQRAWLRDDGKGERQAEARRAARAVGIEAQGGLRS